MEGRRERLQALFLPKARRMATGMAPCPRNFQHHAYGRMFPCAAASKVCRNGCAKVNLVQGRDCKVMPILSLWVRKAVPFASSKIAHASRFD